MRSFFAMAFLGLSTLTGVGACSHSAPQAGPGGNPDQNLTPAQACGALADAFCGQLGTCAPALLQLIYGDAPTCADRQRLDCAGTTSAPGTTRVTADVTACASGLRDAACDGFFAALEGCTVSPGTFADKAACGVDAQCASTHCKRDSGGCGTCAPTVAAGDSCADDPGACVPGTICDSRKLCAVRTPKGGSCAKGEICETPFVCDGATCGDGSAPGAACGEHLGPCNPLLGRCDPTTSKCVELGFALAGEACGLVGGKAVFCSGLGTCNIASGATKGTCSASAADGDSCGQSGPSCMPPASCVGGTCSVENPATCK
jgi:hypothetical protein